MRVPPLGNGRWIYILLVGVCLAAVALTWLAPAFTFSGDVVYRGF